MTQRPIFMVRGVYSWIVKSPLAPVVSGIQVRIGLLFVTAWYHNFGINPSRTWRIGLYRIMTQSSVNCFV